MLDRPFAPPTSPFAPPTDATLSADPVTAAQLRDDPAPLLAGRDPGAMDEAVGAHDGSDHAGEPTWSTSQGAGADVDTDVSEGRASTHDDLAASAAPERGRSDGVEPQVAREVAVAETGDAVSSVAAAIGEDVVALLDLPRWTEHLHTLPAWLDGDRASTMLLRQPPVRVLLTALREHASVGSDGAQETVMLLVLSGAVSIAWRDEIARVGEGEVMVVPGGGGWRVTSDVPETVLLSTFWGTPGTGTSDGTGAASDA